MSRRRCIRSEARRSFATTNRRAPCAGASAPGTPTISTSVGPSLAEKRAVLRGFRWRRGRRYRLDAARDRDGGIHHARLARLPITRGVRARAHAGRQQFNGGHRRAPLCRRSDARKGEARVRHPARPTPEQRRRVRGDPLHERVLQFRVPRRGYRRLRQYDRRGTRALVEHPASELERSNGGARTGNVRSHRFSSLRARRTRRRCLRV